MLPNTDRLKRMSRILNYQLSSNALLILSFFNGWLILLLVTAVIAFMPYILFVLWTEKRFGWITFFVILVIIPLLLEFIFFYHTAGFAMLLIIPLAFLVFYCFLLKYTVKDWIEEREAYLLRYFKNHDIFN